MQNDSKLNNNYIFFCNAIGDYIMALPTFRALLNIFKGNISIIYNKGFIIDNILEEINFKKRIGIEFQEINDQRWFDQEHFLHLIEDKSNFIYLNTWLNRHNITSLLNKIKFCSTVGFYSHFENRICYTDKIHNFDLNFRFVEFFNPQIDINDFSYEPKFNTDFNRILKIIKQNKPSNVKYLCIHFDSEAEKSVNLEIAYDFINKVIERFEDYLIIPIGLQEYNDDYRLLDKDRVLNIGNPLPFLIACAYLYSSDYFVGVDSCFLHIADLKRIPSVGIFGPTSPIEFGIRFSKEREHIKAEGGVISNIDAQDIFDSLLKLVDNDKKI